MPPVRCGLDSFSVQNVLRAHCMVVRYRQKPVSMLSFRFIYHGSFSLAIQRLLLKRGVTLDNAREQ